MRVVLALLSLVVCSALAPIANAGSPLGESIKDISVAEHWIYDDFPKAVAEAKATGKPLLVVVRCVPCPPGRALDEKVMQPDKDLEALEKKFVCVRLIQANSLDLNVFEYDFDMSWSCVFLNADMTVYGRYGTRSAGTRNEADGLLSVAAFGKAAQRALALHAAYPGNKEQLAGKAARKPEYATPRQVPGLETRPASASVRQECIHCHMIKDFALRAKWEQGRLTTADLYVYPLPTSIGLTTDLDDGLKITAVATGSPAAAAGLAAGDDLVSINRQPLISLADIQWALNAAPNEGALAVQIKRDGKLLDKSVTVRGDWKKADIAWRESSWPVLRRGLKVESLPAAERASRGIPSGNMAFVVKGLFGQGEHPAKKAGLQQDDVIVAMDGKSEELSESDFLVAFRLNHGPKDVVKFTVLRGSDRRELTIPMW